MIDFSTQIQSQLLTIGLPVYFEHFLTKETEVPCLSWRVENDYTRVRGDNLSFSWIYVAVKIWGKSKEIFEQYSDSVDQLMHKMGFERIATNELWATGIGQLELRYSGTYKENL